MADDVGRRLRDAAEILAKQAARNASWSARIPPSIAISGGGDEYTISTGVPPAYPNEFGVWHPVFGGRGTKRPEAPWVKNKHRPFMRPAADQAGDRALGVFALVIDDWARKNGYHLRSV